MLKYLFTAHFADNTTIKQGQDDRSAISPDRRSAFYDVQKYSETSPLVGFVLVDTTEPGTNHYGVNLQTGEFVVNGARFFLHEEPCREFRIIFFRRHTHSIAQNYDQMRHEIVYRLGWQATSLDGKNYQGVIQFY